MLQVLHTIIFLIFVAIFIGVDGILLVVGFHRSLQLPILVGILREEVSEVGAGHHLFRVGDKRTDTDGVNRQRAMGLQKRQ